jgi:hypothetical protein
MRLVSWEANGVRLTLAGPLSLTRLVQLAMAIAPVR